MFPSDGEEGLGTIRLLVVCTANVCRSPLVAALIQQRLADTNLSEGIRIESAGVYGHTGDSIDPVVLDLLRELGIEPAAHRATPVEESALHGADLVLVMEEAHRQALFYRLPAALPKIFMLSELAGRYEDIRDPHGQDLADYRATFDQVTELLEAGWPTLMQKLQKKNTGV